ncbi:F-box/LRR-repeat protein At3g26922-like isoform X2 [Salvia miltiorrhiza]|uniref:F-box/LRR-repeat protein At3g26922-like isoform X2 n=1 Tax=Salvia miltiorrhiza TaxID=226208 RepID=UPI0025ABEEFC|nr:F-box/LRR-repeat protein At3g26922-like isoform X2 [Salvia miltiorrhiza]
MGLGGGGWGTGGYSLFFSHSSLIKLVKYCLYTLQRTLLSAKTCSKIPLRSPKNPFLQLIQNPRIPKTFKKALQNSSIHIRNFPKFTAEPTLITTLPISAMEPKRKKSRKIEESIEKPYPDRLSSLPDSVLTHVFSFLDFESVVRTSVLSKRYKHLWTLTPSLDFHLSEHGDDKIRPNDHRLRARDKEGCNSVFELYVNHILQLREHCNLSQFRLSLHRHARPEFVQNCLIYAVEHKVQHLKLRGIFNRKPLALPGILLDLPSLISLSLHNATVNGIELPKSFSLPNLKNLSLKNYEFSDKNYNVGLFSGCPSLETLILTKCSIRPMNKLKCLDVKCSNLKHLEIRRWRSPWRCFDEHVINVNAPRLAFLKFQGPLVRLNFGEAFPCVERACFELFFPTACVMLDGEGRKQRVSECLLGMLLNVCSSVRALSLSLRTIEVVCSIRDLRAHAPVIFENLRIIRFTTENKFREKAFPVETVSCLLDKTATDVLTFDGFKVKRVPPEVSKAKSKRHATHISIPMHFVKFLLESSPSAELLSLEMPNLFVCVQLSSDEEWC